MPIFFYFRRPITAEERDGTKKPFRYEIGQKIYNNQVGEIQIIDRWHGNGGDFYDVVIIRNGSTWTFEEAEIVMGYDLRKNKNAD